MLDHGDMKAVKSLLIIRAIENASQMIGDMTGLYKPIDTEGKETRIFTA